MSLQKNITKTMNEITNEINACTSPTIDFERKLNILKSSVNSVVNLSPEDIIFENNIRNKVDEESQEFQRLCESIKKYGLLENIVAELKISNDKTSYQLICIAGHRRLTALKKLGINNKIPCLIKQYNNVDRVGAALSENLNREGLHCVDIANGYKYLLDNNWTVEQIATHFERDRKTISRFLKLAEMPEDIKESFQKNTELFTNRVIFNEILPKNKLPGEVRKIIDRKLSKKTPEKISARAKLNDKLQEFFDKEKLSNTQKELILHAFKFMGLLK